MNALLNIDTSASGSEKRWGVMRTLEDESQVVLEACLGSTAAFETLLSYYEPKVRRLIYGMTHDVQLTQDLCQETFMAAYRAMKSMQGAELNFAPWVYRIALNQVRSEWRKRKHVTVLSFATARGHEDEEKSEPGEDYFMSEESFEENVLQRDLVQQALGQLSESSVTCLLLDAEGFSYREIAEAVKDSVPAIRSRLSRARQTFRQIYQNLEQETLA